jgi:hypothetical protein
MLLIVRKQDFSKFRIVSKKRELNRVQVVCFSLERLYNFLVDNM